MEALLGVALVLALADGAVSAPPEECTCAVAMETDGWCEAHDLGYIASVEIVSARLFDALDAHGHDVDPDSFACETCRAAIRAGDFCEEHAIGFVHGQAYFSRLTYELARAERRAESEIACPVCRENSHGHGWCASCGVGMVGGAEIRDRQAYDRVEHALEILHTANEAVARCERCAVAIVTDTQCPVCRISYEDGKPVRGTGQ